MIPHIFGWFTMSSVWFILIVQLENSKRDIDQISDRNIPDWVNALVRTHTRHSTHLLKLTPTLTLTRFTAPS